MSRILAVFGTRPQFLKVAALWRVARDLRGVELVFADSGQHYSPELSAIFRHQLDFPPVQWVLNAGGDAPSALSARVVEGVGRIVREVAPRAVMVFGDTNTTLAAAVGAAAEGVPVIHVEAGLRSHDLSMPEEINRRATDHLSRWLLTPTRAAGEQLAREGVDASRVRFAGDLTLDLFDALYRPPSTRSPARPRIVVTAHRAANVDDPRRLGTLLDVLAVLAQYADVRFFVHPRTRARIETSGFGARLAGISLLSPIGYMEMLEEIGQSALVITDSGGLQKDAVFAGRACVVYRDVTEWQELVGNGVWLADDRETLLAESRRLIGTATQFDRALYGGGAAGQRICDLLREAFA